jgi:type III pantothenate kinase
MLLALDAGNTNVTIGVFEAERLAHQWRLRTIRDQTSDEWGILLRTLFLLENVDLGAIDGVIIASVVPPINPRLSEMCQRYFRCEPLFVSSEIDVGLKILYENPRDVGADRIVNGVAALQKYGGPCVVVDLGTAITLDCVSGNAEYLGGVICPGIGISVDALFSRTARLPLVEFRRPDKLIGNNTAASIESGLYYGAIGLIDGILERLLTELGPQTQCVATGGQAELIARGSCYLKNVDLDLTLVGLRIIWEQNRK